MRRSPVDVRYGRALSIGHTFLDVAGDVWVVKQVHRFDCDVVLERGGRRLRPTFAELRRDFVPLTETLLEDAA